MKLNQEYIESEFKKELSKRLDQLEGQTLFWDMNELLRQTCMSVNFLKEHFLYEKDFPKYRVGKKWVFPAKEVSEYLLERIKQYPYE
ncbi:group-specific protein [Jeotgalibacillus salarius]|uniref:group-specific protein n=1 Tax=Jeotgalibacillus salarius TaxID=546023 RepID=UPI001FC8A8C4|nr:group-specific protein [Jeotgalibacillus salarius]